MGCGNSRLEDLPAVALCRDRCRFIDEALRINQSFGDAHFAYVDTLKSISTSLTTFLISQSNGRDDDSATKPPPPAAAPNQPNSSDSHLRFPPDSDDETVDKNDKNGFALEDDENRRLIAHSFGLSNSGGAAGGEAPPPPPAALGSGWDFLNLFETFEKYERLYCASEANLERTDSEKADSDGGEKKAAKESGETTTYDVRVVEKKKKKETPEKVSRDSPESNVSTTIGVSEAMSEVEALFVRASESGREVLKLLYHCHSSNVKQDSLRLSFEEDFGLSSRNLMTSLKKLLLWEKKLYCEVKAEEKLRIMYQRKLQELKYLESENAKLNKANSTRALLRDLTTKLKIAFQIVDRISIAINKLRDEELWPQIKELNLRLLPMCKTMLECHKSQYQKIAEAKGLNAMSSREKLNASDVKAAIELKLELQTWSLSFTDWVQSQKEHARSLNDWLTRCVLYEPEETPDGPFPFSPGRIGAPPIFVICNHWSQAIDRLSEKEVIAAIKGFVAYIDTILSREHNVDTLQALLADKEMERRVRILKKQEQNILQKMHSEVISTRSCGDSQQGMMNIFMAIEKFMANSIQVYEEIRIRIEQVGEKAPESFIGA